MRRGVSTRAPTISALLFVAGVSIGLDTTPTVSGKFNTARKLGASDMAGPGHYLVGVPYTVYYCLGYAVRGTDWHTSFA